MSTDNTPIRVLIVDDHALWREGLASVINRQPDMEVAGEAGTGKEAVEAYRLHRPDLVLMDLRMPGIMGGVEATAAVVREDPLARVIVLTTYDGDDDIYRALKACAKAYLLKDMSSGELTDAIRAVRGGARRMSPAAAANLAGRVGGDELTPRELDVLRFIVRGLSNKEIAAELGIVEGTVKGFVNLIFQKLGVSDRTQAATTALRRGIVHME